MSPDDISYFAFTRKAAHEARDRAVSRFNLDQDKNFTYFRTLHSLAFQVLGMSGSEILGDKGLRGFSEEAGVDLSTNGAEHIADDGFTLMKSNNPIAWDGCAGTYTFGPSSKWAGNKYVA